MFNPYPFVLNIYSSFTKNSARRYSGTSKLHFYILALILTFKR